MSTSSQPYRPQRTWPVFGLIRFEGRASRSHWWLVTAIVLVLVWGVALPQVMKPTYQPAPTDMQDGGAYPPALALLIVTLLALGIALMLAVSVRRLHDRNKSGWWASLYLVPVIGPLWLLVELGALSGTRGLNRYG